MSDAHRLEPADERAGPPRLLTIAEAAALAGVSKKAMRSRVDRSQAAPDRPSSLRVVMRDGERHLPLAELVRVGILTPEGTPAEPPPPAPRAEAAPAAREATPPAPTVLVDVDALMGRVERLAGELRERQVLEAQAGERERNERQARHALEAELQRARAELAQAEARAEAAEARLAEATPPDPPAPPPPAADEPPAARQDGDAAGDAGKAVTSPRSGLWARITGRSGRLTALPVVAPA